ncbi:hypothetical protein PMAYCL1PPCAC_30440, partial [Pristionchus mayeri]
CRIEHRRPFCSESIASPFRPLSMAGVLSAGLTSPRKREYGHWSEVISSAGKVYYYNRVTEQSQWIKPDGWEKAESVIFPVIDRLQQSREESGFGENLQTEISDDDMDVSYGNSPTGLSSSPTSSTEGRSHSSKENRDDEKGIEDEGMEFSIDKYYRAELVASLHDRFEMEKMRDAHALRSSCAFEIEFATQQTQMYRARALARTAMAKALESQGDVTTLSRIQNHLEESRVYFQANFEPEMRRILQGPHEKEKIETDKRSDGNGKVGKREDSGQVSETT